jgi:glycerol-3-phosphate dehydrogenase
VRRYGKNPYYLPAVELDPQLVNPSDDIHEAAESAGVIILVTPAAYLKAALDRAEYSDLAGKTSVRESRE